MSNVAKVFNCPGWFFPFVVQKKILLQQIWEKKLDLDDVVPNNVSGTWEKWKTELPVITNRTVSRCYFPKNVEAMSLELHRFSDVSGKPMLGGLSQGT